MNVNLPSISTSRAQDGCYAEEALLPSIHTEAMRRSPGPAFPTVKPGGVPAVDPQTEADLGSLSRRLAFYFSLGLIFLRFSMLHELITTVLGVNTYLLYVVGPPALLGILLTGGIRRTMRLRLAYYWIAFIAWLLLDVLFSSWRGGSFSTVFEFIRVQFPMLFALAGLALTWKECRVIMYTLAAAALMSVAAGHFFGVADNGERWSLGFGTIANSNDFAGHLLLVLPFLLFLVISPGKPAILRLVSLFAILYGLYEILATASRGAELGLIAAGLYGFSKSSRLVKMSLLAIIPVVVLVLIAVLPQRVLTRLQNFSTSVQNPSDETEEAAESAQTRRYLFNTSVQFIIEHPLFGVGPGQFSSFEGKSSLEAGRRGSWHSTHNIFTQIASECGLPALLLLVAALFSTFRIFSRLRTHARSHQLREIVCATLCIQTGMVGFLTAACFLNVAYLFYLPSLTGLAIVFYFAVEREIALLPRVRPASLRMPEQPARMASQVPQRRLRFGGYRRTAPAK